MEDRSWVVFTNKGKKIFGVLHRPVEKKNVPAVLFCHGFEGNKCGKHRAYVTMAEKLVESGICVLRFDYRGSGDSEGSFQDVTLDGEIEDALMALDFLLEDKDIDSQRIGILGRSLGGTIATKIASSTRRIKSLSLWAPVVSSKFWKELWISSKKNCLNEAQQKEMQRLEGQIPNEEFLRQFFKLDLTEDIQQTRHLPVLLIHGEKDSIVNIDQSEQFMRMRADASETRFLRLAESQHDFSFMPEFKQAMQETIEWFKRTL